MIEMTSKLTMLACLLLLGVGCGSSAEDEAAAAGPPRKTVQEPLSEFLEHPQEALKGDVVVYEIDGEIAIKTEFNIAFRGLNIKRSSAREQSGTVERDCSFVRGKIQDGKPLDPTCEGENPLTKIPTFATEYSATHKTSGEKYKYEWERARYPGRHILRHRIRKLP
jgi:hypothetical protein